MSNGNAIFSLCETSRQAQFKPDVTSFFVGWCLYENFRSFLPRPCFVLRHCPHYAVGIWKQRFHSENASNVFCPHYGGGILKCSNHRSFWIYVWEKVSKGSHDYCDAIVFKKLFFEMFSVHTKTKILHFQIPPVWKAFSKSFIFVMD